jgi:fermentation-respiration switch protein FrsA (DUF1100 family)
LSRRSRSAALLVAVVLLAVAGGVAACAWWQASPAGIASRKGRIVAATVTPAEQDAISTLSRLRLESSTGLAVDALVRAPRGSGPHAAAVLLGGMNRGKRVVRVAGLEAIAARAVLVSPDYPLRWGKRDWRGLGFFRLAAQVRPAALDAVADTLLLVDYLVSRPDVARDRIFLVGSSLGAPAVTIAGGLDPRPAAVIALYGGGRIGDLAAHGMALSGPSTYPRWQATALGHAVGWLLAPLAPERYVAAIAPRPFLMINGADDSLVPRASVLALYEAARVPKELIWVHGEHVQPDEAALIARLAGTIETWLTSRGLLR